MLLRTLGASLLANMLACIAKIPGQEVIRAWKGAIRAGQDFNAVSYSNLFWNTKILSKWT